MRSECASSIYLHIYPEAPSDHNKLQYSCNDEPKSDYITPIFSIDRIILDKTL